MQKRAVSRALAFFVGLAPGSALAANVDVTVSCCTFTPANVTIDAGDTVTWHKTDSYIYPHTVTSGASSNPADNPGALFDASLGTTGQTFTFTFRQTGTIPYFCRNHEIYGMRGTVIVRCRPGDVNTGAGARADALTVNGSTGDPQNRVVTVAVNAPITVSFSAGPGGPNPGNYALWAWLTPISTETTLTVNGATLGCVANPTPFDGGAPQPFRCLMSAGMSPTFCGTVRRFRSPESVPWTVTRSQGFARAATIVLQGVIADANSASPAGLSITNAVLVQFQ